MASGGESDTRNYYDMIAARQELELCPALERLDRVIAASEGIDPDNLTFAFRPLWQLDAATAATIALQKAQATQVYAGLNLWPKATTARLVEAQLAEEGTYPNAGAVFAEGAAAGSASATPTLDYDPDQPRDRHGRWTTGSESGGDTPLAASSGVASSFERPGGVAPTQAAPASSEEEQGASTRPTETEADPVDPASKQLALTALEPLLALLTLRQRALEALRGIVNNLPNWLGGLPPDPPPSAQTAGSVGGELAPSAESLPRPLTIHGGSRSIDPNGEQVSFSEQAGKAVWTIEVPSGLTIPVKSGKPTEEGKDYEGKVRKELQFDSAPGDYEEGGNMPDGITAVPNSDAKIALEVKYLSASERQLRDPDRNLQFAFGPDLAQARKYFGAYKGGLLWVTNDARLAAKYGRDFEDAGLSGIRIVVIPSIQE